MSEYYFDSNQIQVFPCANRSVDEASRFTTEYNLTHLGSCRTQIISSVSSDAERLIQCWVKGYYFKFILTNAALSYLIDNGRNGGKLYLQICLSSDSTEAISTSVADQRKLISFNGPDEPLDGPLDELSDQPSVQGTKFYGVKVTTDNSNNSNSLLLRDADGNWLTATIPSYLRLLGPNGKTYKISVNTNGTGLDIEEV